MALKEYISEQDFFDYWESFPEQENLYERKKPGTAWRNGDANDMGITYFGEHLWFRISYPHGGLRPWIMFFEYPNEGEWKCLYKTQLRVDSINDLNEFANMLMFCVTERKEN